MRTLICALIVTVASAAGCGSLPAPGDHPAAGSDGGSGVNANERALTLPGFDVGPGQEQTLCAYVPSDGAEHWVNSITIDMSAGSHHLVVYRVIDDGSPARGPEPCKTGIPMGMLPGAQERHTEIPLPAGMAMKLGKNEGLYFQMHYINATTSDVIHAAVTYKMKSIDATAVTQVAGELFYGIWSLNVPPGPSVSKESCKAPADLNLIVATGHMHKHATAFDALVNTGTLYHTDNWDQPSWAGYPAPGYAVKKGDAISWACTYDNQTGATIHFGDSAAKDEMCILVGIYYPAPNSQTLFACQH